MRGRSGTGRAVSRLRSPLVAVWVALAGSIAESHPVNMDCVDQQFWFRAEPRRLVVAVSVLFHEFPSLVRRKAMDMDGNGEISGEEARAYAEKARRELLAALSLWVNGQRVALRPLCPLTVDLLGDSQVVPFNHVERAEFAAQVDAAAGGKARVAFETNAFPDVPGFFRYWVSGAGMKVVWRSFVEEAPVDPDAAVAPGKPLRHVEFAYVRAELAQGGETEAEPSARRERPRARPEAFTTGFRAFQKHVAAYFRREFRFWGFVVLVLLAFVYGAFHALAPGHAKTITAAYLIGSQARPWHAVVLGLVVTVSHTWSIYALALVTHFFYGGRVRPQIHGLVMAGSGGLIALLGIAQFLSRLCGRTLLGHTHTHGGHLHAHDHTHTHAEHLHAHTHTHEQPHVDDHAHPHGHAHVDDHAHKDGHDHVHVGAKHLGPEAVSMKSLALLGFSGGIVPCPGALWIYFLSLSLHRTLEGIILITALGAGLATVLVVVGLVTVRVRRNLFDGGEGGELRLFRRLPGLGGRVGQWGDRALAWFGRSLRLIAPCIIAAVGLVLVFWGLLSAGVIGA